METFEPNDNDTKRKIKIFFFEIKKYSFSITLRTSLTNESLIEKSF
jgi:hypothetical protein